MQRRLLNEKCIESYQTSVWNLGNRSHGLLCTSSQDRRILAAEEKADTQLVDRPIVHLVAVVNAGQAHDLTVPFARTANDFHRILKYLALELARHAELDCKVIRTDQDHVCSFDRRNLIDTLDAFLGLNHEKDAGAAGICF